MNKSECNCGQIAINMRDVEKEGLIKGIILLCIIDPKNFQFPLSKNWGKRYMEASAELGKFTRDNKDVLYADSSDVFYYSNAIIKWLNERHENTSNGYHESLYMDLVECIEGIKEDNFWNSACIRCKYTNFGSSLTQRYSNE